VLKEVATEITNEQELDPQSPLPYNPLQEKQFLSLEIRQRAYPG
jgi:hypothetical protein